MDWAFANSDSKWIAFIDSDDWIHRQYLEQLFYAAEKLHADASLVYYQSVADNEVIPVRHIAAEPYLISKREACRRIDDYEYGLSYSASWGKLFRKELWNTLRFPPGKLFEDVFTTHEAFYSADNVAVLEEPLYYYLRRNTSILGSGFYLKRLDRLDGYKAKADFYLAHGETELFHYVRIVYLDALIADSRACRKELHDLSAAAKLKNEFVELFDQEKKHLSFFNKNSFWRFRYPYFKLIIGLCCAPVWLLENIRNKGLSNTIEKCKDKIK